MPGIASAATAVVIAHIAGGTSTLRVGAGGIMLPNHAPYIVAEQFGTLAQLFPGRIDLGLGRSEEHTSELQSLMRISYAVFCLKKKKNTRNTIWRVYRKTHHIE